MSRRFWILFSLLLIPCTINAQDQKKVAFGDEEIISFDLFGKSVALDEEWAAVGAPGRGAAHVDPGTVYLWRFSGQDWVQHSRLEPSDGENGDQFGGALAIHGGTLVVTGDKSLYVFTWDGASWSEFQKLSASDGSRFHGNMGSVSVDSTTIVAGSTSSTSLETAAGKAVVFKLNGSAWEEDQTLVPSSSSKGDYFGTAVVIADDQIVVGAPEDDSVNGSDAGTVFYFSKVGNAWTETGTITASQGSPNDRFGGALAYHNSNLLVGAALTDTNGENSGTAYLFQKNDSAWSEGQVLQGPKNPWSRFGSAVAIRGDALVVGARTQTNSRGTGAGAAYVFEHNGSNWGQKGYLLASDGSEYDEFGSGVAINSNAIIVGAQQPYTEVGGIIHGGNGAAYLFKQGSDWAEVKKFGPAERAQSDRFGVAVRGDSQTLAVGGDDNSRKGAVWIFRKSGESWERETILRGSLSSATNSWQSRFGFLLDLDGEVVVVSDGTSKGVYVFERSGTSWEEKILVTVPDGLSDIFGFGESVALDGDRFVVGSYGGPATVFKRSGSTWVFEAGLTDENDSMGGGVAISGNRIAAGCRWDANQHGDRAGAVRVFRLEGSEWVQESVLLSSTGEAFHGFGKVVAMEGDIIAAAGREDPRYVFVFERTSGGNQWVEAAKLARPDGSSFDADVLSIGIDGTRIVVGADREERVYFFERVGGVWSEGIPYSTFDSASGANFGFSVDIQGNLILAGSPEDDNLNGTRAGSAYLLSLLGPEIYSLYFAQFGDGGTLFSQIVLSAPYSDSDALVDVEIRDDEGDPLTVDLNGVVVEGQTNVTVPAGGLRRLKTDGMGPVGVGSVSVMSDQDLSGVILFGGPIGLAGVGSSFAVRDGFLAPMQTQAQQINTGIAVMNLEDSPSSLDLELAYKSGEILGQASLSLEPRGHKALYVSQFEWEPSVNFWDFRGVLRARVTSGSVAATVIQDRSGEFATFPVVAYPGAAPADSHLNNLYFAQFGEGGFQLWSEILLFGLGRETAVAGTIYLKDDDGLPLTVDLNGNDVEGELDFSIPAGGVSVYQTDSLGAIKAGSVSVEADGPIGGVIVFGGSVGLAGVGSSEELPTGFSAPMESNSAAKTNTGIAVMNLEDQETNLQLGLYDTEGSLLASAQSSLDANGHDAKFLSQFAWDANVDLSNFEGILKVTTDGRVAATVIQTRPGQFATMPVIKK